MLYNPSINTDNIWTHNTRNTIITSPFSYEMLIIIYHAEISDVA